MQTPTWRRRHSAAVVVATTLLLLLSLLTAAPRLAGAQQASSSSTEALPAASSTSLAASAVAAAAAGIPLAKPDYTVYKTRERAFDEIERLIAANPGTMRLDVIEAPPVPKNKENGIVKKATYSPPLRVVTVEPAGLSPGPPNSAAERESYANKYRLLLNYGEHGRELVTVESALVLLRDLAGANLERAAAAADSDPRRSSLGGSTRLRALLKQTVFKIVPMENERGRELVERGQLCERKNGRGVDPNRNWGVDWGKMESDYDPSEEFPGEAPFSEPEARSLAALAAAFAPHAWINVHSGMEAVFSPYDHIAATPKGREADATAELLAAVDAAACGGRCAKGSGGAAVGYLAHGTATDFMYDVLKVPVASTWEIYGDDEADFEDCFKMFNPTAATEAEAEERERVEVSSKTAAKKRKKRMPALETVAAAWADGALVVLENLPSHPGVKLGPEARDAQANAGRAAAAQFDGTVVVVGGGEEGGGEGREEGARGGGGAATTNVSRSTKASSSSRPLPRPMGGHAVPSSSTASSPSSSSSSNSSIHWLSGAIVAFAAGAFVVKRRKQQQQHNSQQQRRREGAAAAAAAAASSGVGVSSVDGVISVGGERGALGLSKPQRQQE